VTLVITKHFVFLHMPKTGGVFIEEVCRARLPPDALVTHALHRHAPYEEIPDAYRGLPVFYLVRNPWDWYVSWYDHLCRTYRDFPYLRDKPFLRTAFASGANDFKQTVLNACTGRISHQLTPIDDRRDYYSARFSWIGGEGLRRGAVEVGRFESLREDFRAFLERHDVPVSAAFAEALRGSRRVNVGERGPYRDYYDAETRDLVAEKARNLIERYDYAF
jgi:hypothetical protein